MSIREKMQEINRQFATKVEEMVATILIHSDIQEEDSDRLKLVRINSMEEAMHSGVRVMTTEVHFDQQVFGAVHLETLHDENSYRFVIKNEYNDQHPLREKYGKA